MIEIGRYNILEIKREARPGFYLGDEEGNEVLLPGKFLPEGGEIGTDMKVFVYCDSEDRPVATLEKPFVQLNGFARLRVKQTNRYGAFLDWGLEKDLLVPFNEQHIPMRARLAYVVRLCLDSKTNRLYGSTKLANFISYEPENISVGDSVRIIIYEQRENGYAVIVNNKYIGMIYEDETYEKVLHGEYKTGFVKKIRTDGKMDITLRPPGYQGVTESINPVLDLLTEAGGFLPYNDKTPPSHIRKIFKMSKKDFKKVIGSLYRERKITICDEGITLVKVKK